MKQNKLRDYQAYLWLLLFAILAYWPMSFMMFSAKNDAIHYFLAMRYNTSEMVQHGIFPAWSPYINFGYPVHGDIQSGVWNPFVFLMSAVRHYDIYWLHTEIILINVLAGAGMFRLLRFLQLEQKTALVIAVAYMLNGYMTDAGQFLNWLYAGALLPFVVMFALKAFQTFRLRDAFGLGASFSLMLLCGYPADTILAGYLLLAWFIYSLLVYANRNGFTQSLKKHSGVGAFTLLCFLLISLPALISFLEFFPEVKRGAGVSLDLAQSNSLAPANLISVLYPWVTLKGDVFSGTDPLIRNCFMGLVTLSFFILFFLQRRKLEPWQKFFGWAALFFFIFSLGRHTPLRYLAYQFIPLMDSFRHPANAKLFFMFIAQVFAAVALNRYLSGETKDRGRLLAISYVLLSLSAIAFIIALVKSQALSMIGNIFQKGFSNFSDTIKMARDSLGSMDLLFMNSFFAVVILFATWLVVKKNLFRKYVLLLVFAEMFIAAQLMIPLTYVRNYKPAEVQRLLDEQPGGYPTPALNATVGQNSRDGMSTFEQIGCLNVYNKKIGRVDYIISPSNLANQEDLWNDDTLRNQILNYSFAFMADTLYAKKTGDKKIINETGPPAPGSSVNSDSVFISKFSPLNMSFRAKSERGGYFVVMQNNYRRWNALVDGKPAEIRTTDRAFIGIPLTPGEHVIELNYRHRDLVILAFISLLFAVAGTIYYYRTGKKRST
jgi:hypothetical protein